MDAKRPKQLGELRDESAEGRGSCTVWNSQCGVLLSSELTKGISNFNP